MPEPVNLCPLCGGNRSRLFDQRSFHGQEVSNRLCLTCGLVYQSPRMTAREAELFYESEYRRIYQGKEDPIKKDIEVQAVRAVSMREFIQQDRDVIRLHLDIGCSAGLLLEEFKTGFGCEGVGVEPGKAYRSYAQSRGLEVYESLDELRKKGNTPFDLISMSHVLEHLPDPVAYLSDLRKNLLTADGRLLLEVPNLFAHDSFEIAHLFSFSKKTLTATVQKAGFDVLRVEVHGRPRSNLIPYYVTLLARAPSDNHMIQSMPVEKWVGCQRRIGLLHRNILMRLLPGKAWMEIP